MTPDRVSSLLGLLLAIPLGLLGLAGVIGDIAVGRPRDLRLAREGRQVTAVVVETRRSYSMYIGRMVSVNPAASRARILDGPWLGRELNIEAGYSIGQRVELTCLPDRFFCQSRASVAEQLAQWPATPTFIVSTALLALGIVGCAWAWRSRA